MRRRMERRNWHEGLRIWLGILLLAGCLAGCSLDQNDAPKAPDQGQPSNQQATALPPQGQVSAGQSAAGNAGSTQIGKIQPTGIVVTGNLPLVDRSPLLDKIALEPRPTVAKGPGPLTNNRLIFVRTGKIIISDALGKTQKELKLNPDQQGVTALSRNPARVWLSPDEKKLAYLSGNNASLWVMNTDGSDNHPISGNLLEDQDAGDFRNETFHTIQRQDVAWSPDSKRLAYLGAKNSQVDLFMSDIDGRNAIQVTNDTLVNGDQIWSPDGQYLAYRSFNKSAAIGEDILVVDRNGTQVVKMDKKAVLDAIKIDPPLFNYQEGPVWLDAKTLILYPQTGKGAYGIWSADTTTGSLRLITKADVVAASWSPTAKKFVAGIRPDEQSIYVIDLQGNQVKVATDQARVPIWSPDGKHIMYVKGDPNNEDKRFDIHIVDPNGKNDVVVANQLRLQQENGQPGPNAKRYWGAKSDRIYFYTIGPSTEDLWVSKLDGTPPQQLTSFEPQQAFYLTAPQVSPDDKAIAFTAFSYLDRLPHLWILSTVGGDWKQIDAGFSWIWWLK
ncbi:MAG: hypothetical protein EXR62_00280 [Chloroflexi bacterium]|nr:hypothetical protein [Chloroflexota bacterium]